MDFKSDGGVWLLLGVALTIAAVVGFDVARRALGRYMSSVDSSKVAIYRIAP